MSRKTIGVLINQIEGSFQSKVWPSIVEAGTKLGYNILFFPGGVIGKEGSVQNELQKNIVYALALSQRISGLILLESTFNKVSKSQFSSFLKNFNDIPMVGISSNHPQINSVTFDNKTYEKDIVSHLIEKHGKKKIAFVSVSSHCHGKERLKGYKAALKEHKIPFKKDLVFDGSFDVQTGVDAVKEFLNVRKVDIDAIAFSNDEMAFGAIKYMNAKGINVPNDIAVVGFDNVDRCTSVSPAISTVAQPINTLSTHAVNTLDNIINNREVSYMIDLKPDLILRESCGCNYSILQTSWEGIAKSDIDDLDQSDWVVLILRKLERMGIIEEDKLSILTILGQLEEDPFVAEHYVKFYNDMKRILLKNKPEISFSINDVEEGQAVILMTEKHIKETKTFTDEEKFLFEQNMSTIKISLAEIKTLLQSKKSFEIQNFYINLRSTMSNISSATTKEDLIKVLEKEFQHLQMNKLFIILYNGDSFHTQKDLTSIPEEAHVFFAADRDSGVRVIKDHETFPPSKILPHELFDLLHASACIVKPILMNELHMGYFLADVRERGRAVEEDIPEILQTLLSSALWNIHLSEQLQKNNERLQELSTKDDLTGLLNRRGFMSIARREYEIASRTGKSFTIAYIDLDGLKIINDTHGHDQGDEAIRGIAVILKKAFRKIDTLGRIGGDEFLLLIPEICKIEDIKGSFNRFKSCISQYNNDEKKAFTLSASYGYATYDKEKKDTTFDDLIEEADSNLYEMKRNRKGKYRKRMPSK